MSATNCPLDVIVFEGQGTPAAYSLETIQIALDDSKTSLGALFLAACFQAFRREFDSLPTDLREVSGLRDDTFTDPTNLLKIPIHLQTNALVVNINLFLVQILRYICHTFPSGSLAVSDTSPLRCSNVIGFSTGLFAATVISCSDSLASLVSHGVEVFRLAFWLGLRTQQYAHLVLSNSSKPLSAENDSWSLVVFGATREESQRSVDEFNVSEYHTHKLYVTAITSTTCVTVSGFPGSLSLFRKSRLPSSATSSKYAHIHTLYHSAELVPVRDLVLSDVQRRGIQFPSFGKPLCSTISGNLIYPRQSSTLLQDVVDMILISPVNFDKVLSSISEQFLPEGLRSPRLVNVGPGVSLARLVSKSLPFGTQFVDLRSPQNSDIPHSLTHSQSNSVHEPIAIVGMAVRFPGADDPQGFWNVVANGVNTLSEIPSSRFDLSPYDGSGSSKRCFRTRTGNFLDDPWSFDNTFFRISPREARSMDPQQRLLLQVSYHALENAGYVPESTRSFAPETFGVYVGVATNDYVENLKNDMDVYYSTGTLQSFLSGKISYAFGFAGPSIVTDTACSSSTVAIHQACRALSTGDCNAALAGGVNVITSPEMFIGLDRAHFLSPSGQCKPWDASADGYSRAEGCGLFVLKRLQDALAENDQILGVIRGVEVNQSGNADSITHPHVSTQVSLFEKLLRSSAISIEDVSVVEAHGTGTKAGDPAELASIRSVFAQKRTHKNPLYVTSIKANIGHSEAASGAAGLAKLLLMFQHRVIPAVISLKELNPSIPPLETDGTIIPTRNTPWEMPPGKGKRIALLNNFGASGSNAALIVEEHLVREARHSRTSCTVFPLAFSAHSQSSVEMLRTEYLRIIDDSSIDQASLANVSYSSVARRQLHRYRISICGSTKESLRSKLLTAPIVSVVEDHAKVVFVFSGQGSQYVGMGSELYQCIPSFRETVDGCHDMLISWGYTGILHLISSDSEVEFADDVQSVQCAVFVIEYALYVLWTSWGIKPDAVIGHSLGEYCALVAAQVITLDDALHLVAERGRLMQEKCAKNETGMLAVKSTAVDVEMALMNQPGFLIACYNSPEDCVVAGELDMLLDLQLKFRESHGWKSVIIDVPFGGHSEAMDPILSELAEASSTVRLASPSIPFASTVLGRVVHPGEDFQALSYSYFVDHCRKPVLFTLAVQSLTKSSGLERDCCWLEVGPHSITLPMLRATLSHNAGEGASFLASLKRGVSGWETMCSSLTALYCTSLVVNWRKVFADLSPNAKLVDLPSYPFARTKFWVDYQEPLDPNTTLQSPQGSQLRSRFTLLDAFVTTPDGEDLSPAVFESSMEKLLPFIDGHKVAGTPLCPASIHLELAGAAVRTSLGSTVECSNDTEIVFSDVSFVNPLVFSFGIPVTIRIVIKFTDFTARSSGSFEICSYSNDDPNKVQTHCRGVYSVISTSSVISKLTICSTMVNNRAKSLSSSSDAEVFHTRTIYPRIFSRIVVYSPPYQAIVSMSVASSGLECYAVMKVPSNTFSGSFSLHPVFSDTIVHAAGFLVNLNAGEGEAFICNQIDKAQIVSGAFNLPDSYGIYCSIGLMEGALVIVDGYVTEQDTKRVIARVKQMRFRKVRLSSFKTVLVSSTTTPISLSPSLSNSSFSSVDSFPFTPSATSASYSFPSISLQQLPPSPSIFSVVKKTIATVLDVPAGAIGDDENLELLGLDSLASIEAGHALSSALKINFPVGIFGTIKTVKSLHMFISSRMSQGDALQTKCAGSACAPSAATSAPSLAVNVLSSVLGIPAADIESDPSLQLAHLGLDSLSAIEVHHALCSDLCMDLPPTIFSSCSTIYDLQNFLDSYSKAHAVAETIVDAIMPTFDNRGLQVLVELQENSVPGAAPLFLIHDGSGLAHVYGRLSSLGRQVWGINNPNFWSDGEWSLVELASRYAELIKSKLRNTTSQCIIGGWSVGGVIAYEVARRLLADGVEVPGIVLIDSPDPNTTTPLPEKIIESIFPKDSNSRHSEVFVSRAQRQLRAASRALVEYEYRTSNINPTMKKLQAVMLRCREPYSPTTSQHDCNSESTEWLSNRSDAQAIIARAGWEKVLGTTVQVLDIPGHHFNLFHSQHVDEVSSQLRNALKMVEIAAWTQREQRGSH